MRREGGAWVPDGRAKTILADCEASLAALEGLPIDLYLIHAPDPRTPWATAVRALARLADDGLVRHIGVANVNRRRLDEALELAPIAAVQVALSVFDDTAVRGGVVERCEESGIAVIAHSPLGGQQRVGPPRPAAGRRRACGGSRRDSGRGRSRLAARSLAGRRPDPWGRAGRRRRGRPRGPPGSSSTKPTGRGRSHGRATARRGRGRAGDGTFRAPARAGSPRTMPPAATSGSTATSAAGRSASWPPRSSRSWPRARSVPSSTTRTCRVPHGAMSSRPRRDRVSQCAASGSTPRSRRLR